MLDTDGVNAFASPGGIIHITRGALGLITSEAELAGVLAHEIGHVAHKHTVNAIKKNKAVQLGTNETLSDRGHVPRQDREQGLRDGAREQVRPRRRDGRRQGIGHADREGRLRARHAGGIPDPSRRAQQGSAGAERPVRVASRNEGADRRDQEARGRQDRAPTVEARYKENVKYEPTPVTAIAQVEDGAAGLTGSTKAKDKKEEAKKEEAKKEEPKKGFGLGSLKPASSSERQTAQVSASGGSRGLGPDRNAKGGGNPAIVKASVSDAEVAAFKKGIA